MALLVYAFKGGIVMKKVLTLCLCLVLLCTPVWAMGAERTNPMTKGYKGDVNIDGEIDAKDALFALRIAVIKKEFPLQEQDAADVTDDHIVNAQDALEILKYAVGKDSVLNKNKVITTIEDEDAYTYWKVLQDDVCTTEQAWLCRTYEDYQAFLELGYVAEPEKLVFPLNEEFFETRGLVLWYRMCGHTTGSLGYRGAFVQGNRLYLDICPYDTCVIDPEHALDRVYGFYYEKGNTPVETVMIRKNYVGFMYRSFALVQFEF